MGRYHSYINSAIKLLRLYKGEMPFSIFARQFFSKEKKYGSKDRKQITALCYSFFRAGRALHQHLTEDTLLTAFFLSNVEDSALLQELKPGWAGAVMNTTEEKIALAGIDVHELFPFAAELSDGMDVDAFCRSFLIQPSLFVRIRPGHTAAVMKKIKEAAVAYTMPQDTTLQFNPGINIAPFITPDKDVVVQDLNSQQVLNTVSTVPYSRPSVWDCCAASGGKSILLYDLLQGELILTVSDIRQSILANLQQRFATAGISNYRHFVADVSNTAKPFPAGEYDIIVCDAPCTGSGTWSRTPEQLFYFDPATIAVFAGRQQKIAAAVLPHLKPGGLFVYITCSVFRKENEEVAAYINQMGMEPVESRNLYGYHSKADSMFVAISRKK